ncbi:DUF1302 domain-containing protein [Pseudomonadota bacterium]
MKKRQGTKFSLRGCPLAVAAALAISSPAHAVQFDWGDWSGSWDNTISYGMSWRGASRDQSLIGVGNGGTAQAVISDDGNLNFDSGDIFSNIIKGTSEIEIDNGQFGGFARIKYWYDFEMMNGGKPHGHSPNSYVSGAELNDDDFHKLAQFSGLYLLDLFAYGTFDLGEMPLDVRLGRQVVNWGEATFIQGINVLNPIDVSAFRRPGAEIKEGLLPVNLFYANLGLGSGWSLEGFYQIKWEETVIDACGTYFSDNDFAAEGCNQLLVPDIGVPDSFLQNLSNIRKDPYIDKARDGGQWGLAVRKYVEQVDTEFGLYYQSLHNRTPSLNLRYNSAAAADGSILIGQGPIPAYYQVQYVEDIDIWGLTFATNVGVVALSGEVSYKKGLPVNINGTTELQAGLGSLQGIAPHPQLGVPVACLIPAPAALGQFGPRAWAAACEYGTGLVNGDPNANGLALGWDRYDVTQAQTTAIYFWDQGLGAERVSFVGEVAWVGVSDLPALSVMPYGRNPIYGSPTTGLGGPSDKGFVTSNSWGYRLRASASYPNVFGGVELIPSIAWAQDVNGTSPTPTFIDGRKALGIALGANYLTKYRATVAYTWYMGGYANTQIDRDFFSINFAMDF